MANSHSPSRWETGARPWEACKQAAGCKIACEAMAAATNSSSDWDLAPGSLAHLAGRGPLACYQPAPLSA